MKSALRMTGVDFFARSSLLGHRIKFLWAMDAHREKED
jgi:hypothetical protein